MFEYSQERIFNSAIDAFSGLDVFQVLDEAKNGAAYKGKKILRVMHFADFDPSFIKGRVIFKTTASDPAKELGSIEIVNPILNEAETVTAELRLALTIELSNSYMSEYATQDSLYGKKPFCINITVKGGETAEVICARLVELIKAQHAYYGNLRFEVWQDSDNKAVLTYKATNEFQRFKNVKFEMMKEFNMAALGHYYPKEPVYVTVATGNLIEHGKEGVGTYWTLLKNVQIQNSYRTNIFSQDNDDSRIREGAKYNQYIFRYVSPRDITGMGAVGQALVSVTEHVLWINQDIADNFETAAKSAGVLIDDVFKSYPETLTVTPPEMNIAVDGNGTITVDAQGANWTPRSLNPEVATVAILDATTANVVGVAAGEALIEIAAEDGRSETVTVVVE